MTNAAINPTAEPLAGSPASTPSAGTTPALATADTSAQAAQPSNAKQELAKILTYAHLGLAIAVQSGVKLGHFGSTDFVTLANEITDLLYDAYKDKL